MDRDKLIETADMVNSCISKEFVKDEHALRVMKGRDPTAEERSDIHPLIREYDPLRKQVLLECFKRCLQIEIDKKYKLNPSLRLWAGCLDAAKKLSLKTQSGPNTRKIRSSVFTERIDILASKDPIYRKGVEIACMWQPDPTISFDGVHDASPARSYEEDWIRRKGTRQVKSCK